MSAAHPTDAYASYEQRWLAAQPHNAIVAVFLPQAQRTRAAAFGTLVHELGTTAFHAREPQAAAAKLAWWRQDLDDAARGRARHPIAQALFADADVRALDPALWPALAAGAAAQLDRSAAATLPEMQAQLAEFFVPVARAERALFGLDPQDAVADATLWTVSHLLHELPALQPDAPRLPLPLGLFARHAVARADLAQPAPSRTALLRDWLDELASAHIAARTQTAARALPLRVRARLDAGRIAAARRASDPLAWLQRRPQPGRFETLFGAWREARAAALG